MTMGKIDEIIERLARMETKQDAHLAGYARDKAVAEERIGKL